MTARWYLWLVERGGALAATTFLVYAWIAPAHIVDGDNAEFATIGALGGVPHPSGYPAYVLWLRLWSWLPGASPAHTAAIATALLTALTVWVLHAACRAWGARPLAAAAAALLFAAGPVALRVQSEAEVFAPNGLVTALVLWLAATRGPLRGRWRVAALGLVAGLGIGNHLTCVLVAPVGILGVARGFREDRGRRIAVVAAGIGALALGLSSYLYLLIAPATWGSWSDLHGLGDLKEHFLREAYGGPGSFAPRSKPVSSLDNLIALARTIGKSLWWVGAVLGLAGLARAVARRSIARSGETRAAWGCLALAFALAGPLLVLRFDIPLDQTGIYVVQRFHLQPTLILVVPLALALDLVATAIVRRASSIHVRPVLAAALPPLVLVAFAIRSLPTLALVHSPAAEMGVRNILHSAPKDAIVIGAPDIFHFGLAYVQGALGIRRDVCPITIVQLNLRHHRDWVRARCGLDLEGLPRDVPVNTYVAELALATGRPVMIDAYQAQIATTFPTYPHGILYRVLPKGSPLPTLDELYAINKELFDRFELDFPHPSRHDEIATKFNELYTRTWHILSDAFHEAGRRTEWEHATRMALRFAPDD